MYKLKPFVFVSSLTLFFFILSSLFPKNVLAQLSDTSVTVNSRLSFKAGVAAGTSGSSLVTITGAGFPDNDTNHLFPGDVVCFTDAGQNGCIGSTTYTVDNVIDSTNFNLTTPLSDNLDTSGYAVATQSG